MSSLAADELEGLLGTMHHTLSVDLRNQVVELAKAQEGGTAGDPAALGALLELKPGVGGAEGALFCVNLERMYMR